MKKIATVSAALVLMFSLAACGPQHCKECDREVYKDGYCEYHYALNVASEVVDGAAQEVFDSIFGG